MKRLLTFLMITITWGLSLSCEKSEYGNNANTVLSADEIDVTWELFEETDSFRLELNVSRLEDKTSMDMRMRLVLDSGALPEGSMISTTDEIMIPVVVESAGNEQIIDLAQYCAPVELGLGHQKPSFTVTLVFPKSGHYLFTVRRAEWEVLKKYEEFSFSCGGSTSEYEGAAVRIDQIIAFN